MSDRRALEFSDRYSIASFTNGEGIIVDLDSGSYFSLNASALSICQILATEARDDVRIHHVAKSMNVPTDEARNLVNEMWLVLSGATPRDPATGSFVYRKVTDDLWALDESGRTIFLVSEKKQQVALEVPLVGLNGPLALYLQALLPKLLALLQVPVLHAACCIIRGHCIAFSGKSGAGKTTTARAFARAGANLLSEDLLVLSFAAGGVFLHREGEYFARTWARETASTMEREPLRPVDFSALTDAGQGDLLPLKAVWFVSANRRSGSDVAVRHLSVSEGALALLGNGFLASSKRDHWREFLQRAKLIADHVDANEATMPDGVPRLEAAARRYIVNSAS
jgi:hypothetical protein